MTLVSVGMSLSVKWRSFWSDLLVHSMKRVCEHGWRDNEVTHALVKEEKIGTLPNVEVIDEIWGILVDLLFYDQDIVVHLGQTDWTGGCGFRCIAVRSAGGLCVTIPVLNVHCVVLSLLDATIYSRVAWIGFNVGVGIIMIVYEVVPDCGRPVRAGTPKAYSVHS